MRVADFNENADKMDADIGDLGQLQTSEKTNLVLAINEAAKSGGSNAPYIDETTLHWMVWDIATAQYVDTGVSAPGPKGDKGEKGDTGDQGLKGETGAGLDILGTYSTLAALEAAVSSPAQGDMYNVGTTASYSIFMWDETELPGEWVDQGVLQGPAGRDGAPGTDGQDGMDGQDGIPGPNQVTTDTATNIIGIIKGTAGKVAQAVVGTDYALPPVEISKTLTAAGWADQQQDIADTAIKSASPGDLRIAQNATDAEFEAWGKAMPRVTAQEAGSITVKATGTIPAIDIPVILEVRG